MPQVPKKDDQFNVELGENPSIHEIYDNLATNAAGKKEKVYCYDKQGKPLKTREARDKAAEWPGGVYFSERLEDGNFKLTYCSVYRPTHVSKPRMVVSDPVIVSKEELDALNKFHTIGYKKEPSGFRKFAYSAFSWIGPVKNALKDVAEYNEYKTNRDIAQKFTLPLENSWNERGKNKTPNVLSFSNQTPEKFKKNMAEKMIEDEIASMKKSNHNPVTDPVDVEFMPKTNIPAGKMQLHGKEKVVSLEHKDVQDMVMDLFPPLKRDELTKAQFDILRSSVKARTDLNAQMGTKQPNDKIARHDKIMASIVLATLIHVVITDKSSKSNEAKDFIRDPENLKALHKLLQDRCSSLPNKVEDIHTLLETPQGKKELLEMGTQTIGLAKERKKELTKALDPKTVDLNNSKTVWAHCEAEIERIEKLRRDGKVIDAFKGASNAKLSPDQLEFLKNAAMDKMQLLDVLQSSDPNSKIGNMIEEEQLASALVAQCIVNSQGKPDGLFAKLSTKSDIQKVVHQLDRQLNTKDMNMGNIFTLMETPEGMAFVQQEVEKAVSIVNSVSVDEPQVQTTAQTKSQGNDAPVFGDADLSGVAPTEAGLAPTEADLPFNTGASQSTVSGASQINISFGQSASPQGQQVDTSAINKDILGPGGNFSLDTDFNFVYDDPSKVLRNQAKETVAVIRNAFETNDFSEVLPELNGVEVNEFEMKIIKDGLIARAMMQDAIANAPDMSKPVALPWGARRDYILASMLISSIINPEGLKLGENQLDIRATLNDPTKYILMMNAMDCFTERREMTPTEIERDVFGLAGNAKEIATQAVDFFDQKLAAAQTQPMANQEVIPMNTQVMPNQEVIPMATQPMPTENIIPMPVMAGNPTMPTENIIPMPVMGLEPTVFDIAVTAAQNGGQVSFTQVNAASEEPLKFTPMEGVMSQSQKAMEAQKQAQQQTVREANDACEIINIL